MIKPIARCQCGRINFGDCKLGIDCVAPTVEFGVINRAVHNSPPPLDDVGGDVDFMLDEKDPQRAKLSPAAAILRQAALIVEGDRAAQHGPKEHNHQNIADHWNAYLGLRLSTPLTALDVALMMVELKVARTKAGQGTYNRDNFVDMAGYAGCAGEIAGHK